MSDNQKHTDAANPIIIPGDYTRCVAALANPMLFRRLQAREDGPPETLDSRKAWARGKSAGNLLGAMHVIRTIRANPGTPPAVLHEVARFERTIRNEHNVRDPWPNDARHDEEFARRHAR